MGSSIRDSSKNLPKWVAPVMQALAYWIGYKKELYRHHLLNEGAIVAELASLINANKSEGDVVKCEQYYDQIDGIKDTKIRADISILRDNKIHTVIEVKREEAGNVLIENDVLKLLSIKERHPKVKCYQIIVAQGKKPRKYVSDKGVSNKIEYAIVDTEYCTKAIRVCKSNSSFKDESPKKANYVCLIEVVASKYS